MKKNLLFICLAALPLMTGCADKNVSILNEANKILAEKSSTINTCYDAVNCVGDKLAKIKLSGNREYAYDSINKKFVIMDGDNIVAKSNGYTPSTDTLDYFKFVTTYNPNLKYSQYLLKEAPAMDALLITTGFDAGTHMDIRNVAYANESRDGRNVLVRAYCDYFSVLAPTQTITHYEDATNVIVTDCAKYNEHGESAYMKAVKGEIYVSNDSTCALDMFERDSKYQDQVKLTSETDSKVYGLVNYAKEDVQATTAYNLVTQEIDTPAEFRTYTSDNTSKNFLRLSSDIIFSDAINNPINVNHSLCIDLNGYKLSFSNFTQGLSGTLEAMRVQSTQDNEIGVYIIDSQGVLDEHSGISLNDCNIVVAGSNDLSVEGKIVPSNFVLNSGKITQTVTKDSQVGAAVTVVGKTQSTEPNKQANFVMYGGKIECINNTSKHNQSGCVAAAGKGANVNIEFGVLKSNEFCVWGTADTTKTYDQSGANVDIQGGTLTSTNNSCIYFPSSSNIEIEGGNINGLSCVSVASGSLNISNSTKLNATGTGGQHSDKCYDGSVIYVPKHNYDDGDLSVTVEESTLTSKYEYIANVKKAADSHMTTFNFNSGTYNYMMSDGLLFADSSLVTVASKQGTWTNTSYK